MKIISTNVGKPKTIEYKGEKITTGIFKFPVNDGIILGNLDVEQDHVIDRRYHGGIDKACYLYSADHYSYWQKMYPELQMPWGMFGENLTVAGLKESQIHIGDTFQIGETVVQATQPRQPCFKLEFRFNDKKIVRKFINSNFPGVYVRILKKGKVKPGDSVICTEQKNTFSVQQVYELLYASEYNPIIKSLVKDPFLAESCRNDLLKRWKKWM